MPPDASTFDYLMEVSERRGAGYLTLLDPDRMTPDELEARALVCAAAGAAISPTPAFGAAVVVMPAFWSGAGRGTSPRAGRYRRRRSHRSARRRRSHRSARRCMAPKTKMGGGGRSFGFGFLWPKNQNPKVINLDF